MSIFLTGRRSATTTLAQMHAYDLNLCTDLHCSRRTLTLAAPRSCPATSSTNALMGVGCHQPVRLPRANPHSVRATTACHFPRFRSLKAFGRRPRCTPRRRDRPASETLNRGGPPGVLTGWSLRRCHDRSMVSAAASKCRRLLQSNAIGRADQHDDAPAAIQSRPCDTPRLRGATNLGLGKPPTSACCRSIMTRTTSRSDA